MEFGRVKVGLGFDCEPPCGGATAFGACKVWKDVVELGQLPETVAVLYFENSICYRGYTLIFRVEVTNRFNNLAFWLIRPYAFGIF